MVIHNNNVYVVDMVEVDPDGDIFKAEIINDDRYKFEVRYYNGGCGFNEAIEEALGNIE